MYKHVDETVFFFKKKNENKKERITIALLFLSHASMIDSFVVSDFINNYLRDREKKYIITDRCEIGRFGSKDDAPVSGLENNIRPPVLRQHVPLPAFLGEMPAPRGREQQQNENEGMRDERDETKEVKKDIRPTVSEMKGRENTDKVEKETRKDGEFDFGTNIKDEKEKEESISKEDAKNEKEITTEMNKKEEEMNKVEVRKEEDKEEEVVTKENTMNKERYTNITEKDAKKDEEPKSEDATNNTNNEKNANTNIKDVKETVEIDDIYDEEGRDNFGKWIFEAYKTSRNIGKVSLLTWRNNLNKIASTPYSIDEEWIINIEVCDNGLVRFGIYETAAHMDWEENPPEFIRRCMYWGRTFEGIMADSEQPGCRTKFCTVIRLDLAGIPAVVGAEMDCIDERTGEYVELKTHSMSKEIPLQKLRKIWIQSYIAGVRHVYVGHRDKFGMVRAIRDLEVSWIPDIVRARTERPVIPSDRNEVWDPFICMSFMSQCLSWILWNVSKHEKETKQFHVHYTPFDTKVTINKGLFSYNKIEKEKH